MAPSDDEEALLRQPAALAVHRHTLALLDRTRDSAIALVHASDDDPEALHDFRVAVRRLRSWLQQWKQLLDDTVSHRLRRDVRDLARATGPARDLQVHAEWLRGEHDRARGHLHTEIARLVDHFEGGRRTAMADARRAAAELVALHVELSRRLGESCVRQHPRRSDDATLGSAVAALLRSASVELHDRLAAVRSSSDHEPLHDARIAAKRMRYLLESLDGTVPGAAVAIRDLKAFQDRAGDANDAHVFAKELKTVYEEGGFKGWSALDRHLRSRGVAAYRSLRRAWLGRGSKEFFDRVERLARRLDRWARA